jgi:hypothetical protein
LIDIWHTVVNVIDEFIDLTKISYKPGGPHGFENFLTRKVGLGPYMLAGGRLDNARFFHLIQTLLQFFSHKWS